MSSQARIDPLSWGIRIDEPAPPVADPLEAWKHPTRFSVMRKVLHEAVHFWHSVSTDFGIRLAFDSLNSMNALRVAARQGQDLTSIGSDWTFEGYRPFELLYAAQSQTTDGLSPMHIFEGLARFWDSFMPMGIPFDELDQALSDEVDLYGAAYRLARHELGPLAPMCFPILGYLALCNESYDPVLLFRESVGRCAQLIKDHELSLEPNPFDGWWRVWQLAAQGRLTMAPPSAPLTTYRQWMKCLTRWKSHYPAELASMGDSWVGGHPILEPYANAVYAVLAESHPGMKRQEVEVQMPFFCAVPAHRNHYQLLVLRLCPPLVTFSDGRRWITPPPTGGDPVTFGEGVRLFSDMMGAAIGLVSNARGATWRNACPQTACPVHGQNLCASVLEYPDSFETCGFRDLVLKKEFHIEGGV